MTPAEIREMLDALSNAEVVAKLDEAVKDCEEAAKAERNSEWHDACFAGVMVFGQEFLKRGIDLRVLH